MASYPPPPFTPPPPYGTPGGWDPRDWRRAMREQTRAQQRMQRDAAKAQREAMRAQRELYRVPRRGSLLGPLLLVLFGVLALLVSMGRLPLGPLLSWYARWWPLSIVLAGVLLLAEWALDQWTATRVAANGAPPFPTRRGLGAGTVFLLILLILIGLSAQGFRDGARALNISGNNFGLNSVGLEELFGQRYQRQQELEQTLAPGTTVEIENPHGDVILTGADTDAQPGGSTNDGRMHIAVSEQLYGASNGDADRKAEQLTPQVRADGPVLRITLPAVEGGVADLNITLPAATPVTVNAGHGDLRVTGLRAPVNVTAGHGEIELNNLGAAVIASMGNRHASLQAHNIGGTLQVKGRGDDLTITDVTGEVSLEGEFFGDTHLARLRGPMLFQTNRTHFSLARLDGEIDISPDSALSGSDIVGPTELRTRSRNISLERVAGAVDVANSNGSVDVTAALPLGNMQVDNRNGEVTVTVPDHAGLAVDAEATGGSIGDALGLHSTSDHDNASLRGQVGNGGTRVQLRTTHADINIRQALASTLPMPPAPPEPPAKPASTAGKLQPRPGKSSKNARKTPPEDTPATQSF